MLLSCDDLDDAINSLASFYGVKKHCIETMFNVKWPAFLSEDINHCDFSVNVELLSFVMAKHLNVSEPANISTYVSYYHRGRFDGSRKWYESGLLPSSDGIRALFEALRDLIPRESFIKLMSRSLAIVDEQISLGGQSEEGPFGFASLEVALGANKTGCDFSLPEFLIESSWVGREEERRQLAEIIIKYLSPVVVKFQVEVADSRSYVAWLWHYLWCKKFSIELPDLVPTYSGHGKAIQSEHILRIFPI
ncbi:hypothetical protein [Cellvibrio fontiphilus]|uniref:Uncharacterized protein n=1 Tax=Cellvibrio fontiphilus TaxID=1815559 RepID=A0ABV7FFS8_9GAMM